MSSELFEALNLLEKERGIQVDFMVDKITKAILTACKNSYDNEDARVEVNPDKGAFDVYLRKEVVDEVFEPNKEISLEDAQKIDPNKFPCLVQIPKNSDALLLKPPEI